MDDGATNSGSMMTQANNAGASWNAGTVGKGAEGNPQDTELYTVCYGV